jgi:glycosyltransferase involved in cell wall biosynthesis
VPARVTYWTGRWEPDKEAISKEVQALRIGDRARAPVVSIAPGQKVSVDVGGRVICLPTRLWPLLRATALAIEPIGHVSHVFGGFSSWHLLRALGRRPVILTAVTARGDGGSPLLPRLPDIVAVETEGLAAEWINAGVAPDRVRVIYPGVDLQEFSPLPKSSLHRLRLLFASSPSTAAELGPRGVPLLVELARARPDIDIIVPWRQWAHKDDASVALRALKYPPNFIVFHGNSADMRRYFAEAHATVALFERSGGKACPNSVIEGLACGRPALVAKSCAVATLLERSGAAILVERDIQSLTLAIDRLAASIDEMASRARAFAEEHFDIRRFSRDYAALYNELSHRNRSNASSIARQPVLSDIAVARNKSDKGSGP